ncbi:type II secretion system GspH family protein [bacterium]|nr:type II secretion system GspH family protein [bacterium]
MINNQPSRPIGRRRGFTLVEMLVSVALVLLMMSMFAAIFQLAAGSTSTQRGIAQNDQRARSVTTTLRSDFDKRTFRNLIAFQANEDANSSATRFDDRSGFFMLSTNDPANKIDNVLSFSISAEMTQKLKDGTKYYGAAKWLKDPRADGSGALIEPGNNILVNNPNQPEIDDGVITNNSAAESTAAQVVYFVRGGNLYRRLLLIRKPMELAGLDLSPHPAFADGTDPFDLDANPATPAYAAHDPTPGVPAPAFTLADAFWRDFDFVAFRNTTGNLQFHGTGSLDNGNGATFFALGKPRFRFGHSLTGGFPRQYTAIPGANTDPAGNSVDVEFIGTFLHEETSYDGDDDFDNGILRGGFNFPQGNARRRGATAAVQPSAGGPPFGDPMDIRVPFALNNRKVVEDFAGGSRRAEDLLLPNVHEFEIEIWDDRLNRWVSPGHAQSVATAGPDGSLGTADDVLAPGDYHASRCYNLSYGPFGVFDPSIRNPLIASQNYEFTNHVFDSWHPTATAGGTMPPFRAMTYYPPVRPDGALEPQSVPFWGPSVLDYTDPSNNSFRSFAVGDTVFARTEDLNGDGDITDTFGGTDEDGSYGVAPNGVPDTEAPNWPFGYAYHYVCVRAGVAGDTAPNWQARPGALTTEQFLGTPPGGTTPAIWRAVTNLRPLKAIRITVRFEDPSSGQMRQNTIVQSLID